MSESGTTPAMDRELLAERVANINRHFDRVEKHLPTDPEDLRPDTQDTDTVVLHLWQAPKWSSTSRCPPAYGWDWTAHRPMMTLSENWPNTTSSRQNWLTGWHERLVSETSSCTHTANSNCSGYTTSPR